jgi:hypothetical protein
VPIGVLGVEVEELCNEEVGHVVINRATTADDTLLEEQGERLRHALHLEAAGLL